MDSMTGPPPSKSVSTTKTPEQKESRIQKTGKEDKSPDDDEVWDYIIHVGGMPSLKLSWVQSGRDVETTLSTTTTKLCIAANDQSGWYRNNLLQSMEW